MWHQSYTSTVKEVTREQIWAVLTDLNHWQDWDPELEYTTCDTQPVVGVDFYLKPKGGPKTRLTVTEMDHPNVFSDLSHLPLAKMHTRHILTETAEGINITVDIKISGLLTFLWKKVIGQPQITGGMAQTERMVAKAKTIQL